MGISARALDIMQRHTWPGNVRELRNVIEFACVCARSERIERQDLPDSIRNPVIAAQGHGVRFEDEKAALLRAAMQRHGGNRVAVAEEMGISRTTLWRRLKAMDIRD